MSSTAAHADDMFVLSNGHDLVTFSLPAAPDASGRAGFAFELTVPVTIDGVTAPDTVIFFDGTAGGGLNIVTSSAADGLAFYDPGVQLYDSGQYPITSTLFAPTFRIGTFQLRDGDPGYEQLSGAFNVTITPADLTTPISATPESSSLWLCGMGAAVFWRATCKRRALRL